MQLFWYQEKNTSLAAHGEGDPAATLSTHGTPHHWQQSFPDIERYPTLTTDDTVHPCQRFRRKR